MGTYENPAMISGPNTGSTSSNIGSKAATKKKDSEYTSDPNTTDFDNITPNAKLDNNKEKLDKTQVNMN